MNRGGGERGGGGGGGGDSRRENKLSEDGRYFWLVIYRNLFREEEALQMHFVVPYVPLLLQSPSGQELRVPHGGIRNVHRFRITKALFKFAVVFVGMKHLLPVLTTTLVDDLQEDRHGKRPFVALSSHQCDVKRDVLFA